MTTKKQAPMIVESKLTKPSRWFVLTRYQEKRGIDTVTGEDVAYLKALEKHDVTDQMRVILKNKRKRASAETAGTGTA